MLLSSEELYCSEEDTGEGVKPSEIKPFFSCNVQSDFQTHLEMQIGGIFV